LRVSHVKILMLGEKP